MKNSLKRLLTKIKNRYYYLNKLFRGQKVKISLVFTKSKGKLKKLIDFSKIGSIFTFLTHFDPN